MRKFDSETLPYTKEIPLDRKVTVQSVFISKYSPYEFSDWVRESMSWKNGCMIGDWSGIHKLILKGPDVLPFMQSISGIKAEPFQTGQGKHVVCTSRRGKVIGEGIMLRLSEDTFKLTGGPAFVEWTEYCLRTSGKWDVAAEIITDREFIFQVQGPFSVQILEAVAGADLKDIAYMHFREVPLLGENVIFLRQGMSGNIGFELQGPDHIATEVYQIIMEAGESFGGVTKVGNAAKGVNHVEACFPTGTWDYTPDLFAEDDQLTQGFLKELGPMADFIAGKLKRKPGGSAEGGAMDAIMSPVELGWSYALCFDHEFPGSEILKAEKASPVRKICTLVWNDEDVQDVFASYFKDAEPYKHFVMPRDYEMAPDIVLKDGRKAGLSLSRAYSVYFRKMISLCVIETELSVPGTEVEVLWGSKEQPQKRIRASVAPAPIFDPDKRRPLK